MYLLEFAGEDDAFAAAEAGAAAGDVTPLAPGLATAAVLDAARAETLAYTRFASELVGTTDADVASARALLDAATTERAGSVAVRARDVHGSTGVDTQRAERELGRVLVDRGFTVDLDDPDHVLRAVFSLDSNDADDPTGVSALGWLAAASVRDYGDRKPTDRPFFQPGSMAPLDARALVNLARVDPGERLLDPMCGTGGVLLEAGLVGAVPLGNDAQAKMARGTRENLTALLPSDARFDVVRGDATRLGLRDDAAAGVVFDAPYGRQSKIETHGLGDLVAGALSEARRVSAGRCVLVADRDWRAEARDADWRVTARFERRVHRSLTRHVLVLDPDE